MISQLVSYKLRVWLDQICLACPDLELAVHGPYLWKHVQLDINDHLIENFGVNSRPQRVVFFWIARVFSKIGLCCNGSWADVSILIVRDPDTIIVINVDNNRMESSISALVSPKYLAINITDCYRTISKVTTQAAEVFVELTQSSLATSQNGH